MKKYTQKITELVRDNAEAFWGIIAIGAILSTIATALGNWFSYNKLGSLLSDNIFLTQGIDPTSIDQAMGLLGDLMIIALISLLIIALFSSFVET